MIRALVAYAVCMTACGGAIARGVGAECGADGGGCASDQMCLTEFKGGYCGEKNCAHDTDCPSGSACIAYMAAADGGTTNYCFLVCINKADCNVTRTTANEANCSSNQTFVDGTMGRKACVPPSG
jgi:hypothetical protein